MTSLGTQQDRSTQIHGYWSGCTRCQFASSLPVLYSLPQPRHRHVSKAFSAPMIILNTSVEAVLLNKINPFKGITKFIVAFHPCIFSQLKDTKSVITTPWALW